MVDFNRITSSIGNILKAGGSPQNPPKPSLEKGFHSSRPNPSEQLQKLEKKYIPYSSYPIVERNPKQERFNAMMEVPGALGKPMWMDQKGYLLNTQGQMTTLMRDYYNARKEGTQEAMQRWAEAYKKVDPELIFAERIVAEGECLVQTGSYTCGGPDPLAMAVVMSESLAVVFSKPYQAVSRPFIAQDIPETSSLKRSSPISNLKARELAEKIANGHAFNKHGKELGFKNPSQMADHIERVISEPYDFRFLERGRSAFWDNDSGTVIIINPATKDQGTVFKPEIGRKYFERVLK